MMKLLVVVCAAIALTAHAVEDTAAVAELNEVQPTLANGGDDTHPNFDNGGESVGYFKRIANFVGPKYGLPGYKESHNWETDFDMMSPLVFDYRYYRALIHEPAADAEAMSEEGLKTHFVGAIEKSEAPNCPQGNIWFNANTFYVLYKDDTEFGMGGKACKLIFQVFLQKMVFRGDPIVVHKTGSGPFPTVGTKLFNPSGARNEHLTKAFFQIGQAQYAETPNANAFRTDNTFSPARHMTIVFWLQVAPQGKAPNAELFNYGGVKSDHYFRTGFGCITEDLTTSACYFIWVFTAAKPEYFHTYNDDNFPKLNAALGGSAWGHVLMMLSTKMPGFPKDHAEGEAVCPNNGAGGAECHAILECYVNSVEIKIVDWAHGTDTDRASKNSWGAELPSGIWEGKETKLGRDDIERRFWIAPANDCEAEGPSKCGGISKNGMMFDFPWFGAYKQGLYICDFASIPSGAGAFGLKARRTIAKNAFWEVMRETVGIACQFSTDGNQAVVNDALTEGHKGNVN